ncbi:MAG: diacylglycerol kinase family protein [Desulforhopalus sp.]
MNDNGGPGRYESYGKPLPLYYNPEAGTSETTLEKIKDDGRIRMVPVSPEKMEILIKEAVSQGTKRVLVSGGDGTISLAASILAGKNTELAIIPCGTLNHFAQRIGIPIDAVEALDIALHCDAHPVDAGYVNDILFINTSSVGAYSVFVRSRKYLQNRMHYFPASIIAGFRRLIRFRRIRVNLAGKQLKTPLVFIGVGERELSFPAMGQNKLQGRQGLHLIAVNCKSSFEAFMLIIKSLFLGMDPLQKQRHIENQLVDTLELNFYRSKSRMRRISVALDGELVRLQTPLKYRFAPGEIMVAIPGKMKM